MSEYCIYLKMPSYLRQWFIHRHGGNLFMEQRGIHEDGTCWDAIAKIYQRLRKNYLTNISKKSSRLQALYITMFLSLSF